MISDDALYRLAVFLGSAAMLLIVLYHFLEVNAVEEPEENEKVLSSTARAGAKSDSSVR
jgi:oligosaccharyl transferase complex subunit OST4